ncbi:hypothetical protein AAF712_002106 [Marasmius tenuissimus]|uniref:Ubiquitin-like domain-containing protein n=1 Tax=Marasmius tenuissimus TaxID=585030 RepID=A0ABR3ABL6_9AGAR|nr:hypothetical protein PM082_005287 [Marasmius tenuissimus]
MSLVQLRVELPTYAHSFTIQVPDVCTIRDVKQEIFNVCPGSPQVNGQRIIWRGRYLADDEKLEDIWKSADEPRIIHLSVLPSAWTSKPPSATTTTGVDQQPSQYQRQPPTPPTLPRKTPSVSQGTGMQSSSSPSSTSKHPLVYVLHKHKRALSLLMRDKSKEEELPSDAAVLRSSAVLFIAGHGLQWPPMLDEPFPEESETGGLAYERTVLEGRTYLRLVNPQEKPTAAQIHALKVLQYTFQILNLPLEHPTPTTVVNTQPVAIPPNLHALLQQIGLPALETEYHRQLLRHFEGQGEHPGQLPAVRVERPLPLPNPNERVIEINLNLRPFLLPLLMLAFRTMLLLYFVAPARKPVFGILIVAWVLYEIWQPIRNGLARMGRNGGQAGQQQQAQGAAGGANQNRDQAAGNGGGAAAGVGAGGARPQGQGQPQPAGVRRNGQGGAAGPLIDTLANYDIQQEEAEFERGDAEEPGFGRKAGAFFTLFLATVHPAVWNRRRVALRQREGRIRTEERARNAPAPDEEANPEEQQSETATARRNAEEESRERLRIRHERRRPWLRNYVQRVVRGEWVDDSD